MPKYSQYFIIEVIARLYFSALNKRNLITLPLNFLLNFSFIFVWLEVFAYAKYIPNDIRPKINSKISFYADMYLFGDHWKELVVQLNNYHLTFVSYFTSFAFLLIGLIVIPLAIWYYIYYIRKLNYNPFEWYDHYLHFNNKSNKKSFRSIAVPFLIPLFCFLALNFVHIFAFQSESNYTKSKDILAWFFYVVFHIMMPIIVAIYLYAFHAPGTVMCFSLSMGIQNLLSVFTHLLLPMAPPWFTHLYGINDEAHVNYTQQGYAAGLTRVDTHMGTHINTKGFHKSPIVFGAVPSVHSAVAFQCALYLVLRSTTQKNRFLSHTPLNRENSDTYPLTLVDSSTIIPKKNNEDSTSTTSVSDDTLTDRQLQSPLQPSSPDSTAQDDTLTPFNLPLDHSSDSYTSSLEDDDSEDFDIDLEFQQNSANNILTKTDSQFVRYYTQDPQVSNRWFFRFFSKGLVPRIVGCMFVCTQWWATMYLDHHYRFDLFIGMLYAYITYLLMNHFVLQPKVIKPFMEVRLGIKEDVDNEGNTMGMRTFKGTKYEWFFDPLA
ncbi:hypothetical protein TBLA_0F03590 [Henningerozyma blattae CBS 6284]|uniref:Inositolphosphotransferase Aur1/Ipt1 domain-containing protein n=1 Tax=Henningerozyma blattae (strain ATCC 34711 / CBS 6284 / DSM 70876 / NBRC 10599 / NRRL Y-10934 / UCD 77-7) TaxID=1071380 RepID=I2H694_HENB6|nr:hypothetical protein TBLA_0F03590 [Tetrapisispora blattae CBS 6284]CCH61896.1 hypothetical protein TBLA_0F03590 [Tetrapisispora blattae CBS 6284]